MRRLLLIVCLASGFAIDARGAGGQELASDEVASLRRALSIDPFAVAPYRLLTSGLGATARRKLSDELAHRGDFSGLVVAARLDADTGQTVGARALLRDAAHHLPSDQRALDAYSMLALSVGAFPEADQATQLALGSARTPQRLVTAAIAELRQGKSKEGLALLAEAKRRDPSGGTVDAALDTLLGQHMVAEAAELLRAQLAPDGKPAPSADAAAWRRLADLERQLGHSDAEAQALLHALDNEAFATGRRSTTQALLRNYRARKALPALLHALKDANTAPRLVLRGDLEAELGKHGEALDSYVAAEKLAPTDPDPPLRLAAMAKTPGERAKRYEALVATHPTELRFALELADLRAAAKDEAGCVRALHDAATRFENAPAAQTEIARRLTAHGDKDGALAARLRAATLDPRNADYALALGDAYRARGKRVDAVKSYYDAIVRADRGRSAYDRSIDSLEAAGYDVEADAVYGEARARWPADLPLLRRYAATLERHRQYQHAGQIWVEIEGKAVRPFDKEQASYNRKRLEDLALVNGPTP